MIFDAKKFANTEWQKWALNHYCDKSSSESLWEFAHSAALDAIKKTAQLQDRMLAKKLVTDFVVNVMRTTGAYVSNDELEKAVEEWEAWNEPGKWIVEPLKDEKASRPQRDALPSQQTNPPIKAFKQADSVEYARTVGPGTVVEIDETKHTVEKVTVLNTGLLLSFTNGGQYIIRDDEPIKIVTASNAPAFWSMRNDRDQVIAVHFNGKEAKQEFDDYTSFTGKEATLSLEA